VETLVRMRYAFDGIKKDPQPEEAAQAAALKDAQSRSDTPGRLGKGPAKAGIPGAASTRPARATALWQAVRRLVRTHAFRLAGLYFLVFALSVIGVLFFVYWTSADFVERQTEATLGAEVTGLSEQYT
jgi:hypothetical protein